jgi:hypothetical protein
MDKRKKIKTSHPGIVYREHPSRLWKGRPDKYFFIRYRLDGKDKSEGVGWLSEEWTLQEVNRILTELKANQKTGEDPRTLAEKRRLARERELEAERRAKQEARNKITFKAYFETVYYPVSETSKKLEFARKEDERFRDKN